jgi:hypothetical protein
MLLRDIEYARFDASPPCLLDMDSPALEAGVLFSVRVETSEAR